MSLLLDALNKADQERQRNQNAPGISSTHEQPQSNQQQLTRIGIAVALIALIIVATAFFWFGKRTTQVAATNVAPKVATPAPSVTAAQTSSTAMETGAPQPLPGVVTNDEDSVATLYQQQNEAAQAQQTQAAQSALAQAQIAPTAVDESQPNPAAQAPVAPPVATQTSITQFANLPEIHDLPRPVLEKIPTLNYTQHSYSDVGASVMINGVVRHANDQLANGLVIEKILQDGMILHMDNYSFKIRALNSWITL